MSHTAEYFITCQRQACKLPRSSTLIIRAEARIISIGEHSAALCAGCFIDVQNDPAFRARDRLYARALLRRDFVLQRAAGGWADPGQAKSRADELEAAQDEVLKAVDDITDWFQTWLGSAPPPLIVLVADPISVGADESAAVSAPPTDCPMCDRTKDIANALCPEHEHLTGETAAAAGRSV